MLCRRFDEFFDGYAGQNGSADVAGSQQIFNFNVFQVQRVANHVVFVVVQKIFRMPHFCQRFDFFANIGFDAVFGRNQSGNQFEQF